MAGPIVFAVTGGKGGVGKSVFAANFAITLGVETRTPVLLIDLDAKSCGDQNLITGMKPVKTVSELVQYTGAINAQTVGSLTARHQSGLHFIGAVRSPDEQLGTDADGIVRLIEAFGRVFPTIVIDIGIRVSAPGPTANAGGIAAANVANEVIKMGRNRTLAPSMAASSTVKPSCLF